MCILLAAGGMFLTPQPAQASAPARESPLEFVAVTDADLERFGPFPFDRKILAQVVHRIRSAEARAVIVKFFLHEDRASDHLLEDAARTIPTYFQMGLQGVRERASDGRLEGTAQRPNRTILPSAAGTGFVTERASTGDRIELEAHADGARVKSLSLLGAELASGHRAEIANGKLLLGKRSFPPRPQRQGPLPLRKSSHANAHFLFRHSGCTAAAHGPLARQGRRHRLSRERHAQNLPGLRPEHSHP